MVSRMLMVVLQRFFMSRRSINQGHSGDLQVALAFDRPKFS